MSATRAERRRDLKARTKATDYAESGFKDRAVYMPFVPSQRNGSRHNGGYTDEELHQRAVGRRDQRRMVEKLITEQAKASKEAARDRKAAAKAKRRALYLTACQKPQPVEYMHSAARRRLAAPVMALAA